MGWRNRKMNTITEEDLKNIKDWKIYKKKVNTKAIRMNESFIVKTSEGLFECKDGYLAMDARGYPYAIDKKEFEMIYREVSENDL